MLLMGGLMLFSSPALASAESPVPSLGDLMKAAGVIAPRQPRPAPAFELPDLNGGRHTLEEERGRLVILNFWATWCAPCVKELPSLESLASHYRDKGLSVVTINVDRSSNKRVGKFVEKHQLTLPVRVDRKGTVRGRYEVPVLPVTYLIDRQGVFIGKVIGDREWNGAAMHALVNRLLTQPPQRP